MDKKCSSRWLLVCVQRVATLIKRHDNFIYTKKSNIIDSSWCYLFKSGGGGGRRGGANFPFINRLMPFLRHSEMF